MRDLPAWPQVQSELNKRTDTFAAVVGDLRDPKFDERSAFAIKLHLTATYADWVVGVYEKESGSESPELGVIYSLYFKKTHVLSCDYAWLTDDKVSSPNEVRRAALQIFFNDGLDDEAKASELEGPRVALPASAHACRTFGPVLLPHTDHTATPPGGTDS